MTNWTSKDKRISLLAFYKAEREQAVTVDQAYLTAKRLTDQLFKDYSADEVVAEDIAELAESLEDEDIFEEHAKGVDFGSEEEITYHEEKKKPYNGAKKEAKIGDSFVGKTGDTMTYRACVSCGKPQWFKGTYKSCYDCNMKKKK